MTDAKARPTATASLGSEAGVDPAITAIDEPLDGGGAALDAGATLGRYVVIGRIGEGGMGVIYSARDPDLDRRVALKLLRQGLSAGSRAQARLLREARAMARLSHPNIAPIYDVGVVGDQVFVAMELVEGATLRDQLAGADWRAAVCAYVQAARGLAAAHAAGFVHRDFKPDNVLVGEDGRARVVDFGLVREDLAEPDSEPGTPARSERETATGSLLGTPAYMAPEAIRGDPVDARADQYSFCVALYHQLYGIYPYGAATVVERGHGLGEPARPPAGASVPDRVHRLLLRGLAAERTARHATMTALADQLERAASRSRARWAMLAGVVAASAGAALAAIAVLRSPPAARGPAVIAAAGPRVDFFVDARAAGIATGEPEHPFPSITAALAAVNRAAGPARTIHIASGVYDASRETFPLELRNGVSLIGEDVRTTSIVGMARIDHAAGGTAVDEPLWVAILVGDPLGAQTIRGIALDPGSDEHQPWGIYCDQGNANPPAPEGTRRPPNLVIDQVAVARFDRSIVIGTSDRPAPSGCNARITRSQIASKAAGVFVTGAGYGSNFPNRVSAQIGGDTAADGNRFLGNRDPGRTGSDDRHVASGIIVYDQSTPIEIRHNTFSDNDIGVQLGNFGLEGAAIVDGNTFTGMTDSAIQLLGNYNLRSLTDNVFLVNNARPGSTRPTCSGKHVLAVALCVFGYGDRGPGPQIQRARGNMFAGNDVGIYVVGTPFTAPRRFDFGTRGDPGNNLFICNSTGRARAGHDLWIATGSPRATLAFEGNRWDYASPRRRGPSAPDGTEIVVEPGGAQLDLGGADAHRRPCPAPHRG